MSDTVLKFFPEDLNFVPDKALQDKAREYLVIEFPEATEVVSKASEKIIFIDAGTNLETITCPDCLYKIDMGWWRLAMKRATETHFTDLTIDTPC